MERHPIIAALKQARQDSGLTQEQIARLVHKTPQAVAKFENGSGDRQMATVEDFAAVYGLRLALVPVEEPS